MKKFIAGTAVAVGLGAAGMFGAGTASAIGFGINGNDIGSVETGESGNASGNTTVAVSLFKPASATAGGNAQGNFLVAVDGDVEALGNSNGNTIVAVGSNARSTGQGNRPGEVSLSACGTSFSGQADHVTLSHGLC